MSQISTTDILDTKAIADGVKRWFNERDWDVKTDATENNHYIRAHKSNWWRAVVGADRALVVHVYSNKDGTFVDVGQGDWTTNIVSNVIWAFATGGTNIAISGWSFISQKQLQSYIQELFDLQTRNS